MSMKKKTILVIAPVVPQPSDISHIASSLAFLEPYCHLDFIDPLSVIDENLGNDAYYLSWQSQLSSYLEYYEAFIGFSFGGVILQQCFPVFENKSLPIVLFSTPTFIDCALNQKLSMVIDLLKKSRVEEALSLLYSNVFYPYQLPSFYWDTLDKAEAARRLVVGLTRVLNTDSSSLVQSTTVDHLHLIGECSNLINSYNVLSPQSGMLVTVPGASMRVLQDNLSFCKKTMMERLGCGA